MNGTEQDWRVRLYISPENVSGPYNANACKKGGRREGKKEKKERVGERMERKREMGGGGRLEKGSRRGGVRMRESEEESERARGKKITFHS